MLISEKEYGEVIVVFGFSDLVVCRAVAKKAHANSREREIVLEKVAPSGSGVTFSSHQTDWSTGPSRVQVSLIAAPHTDTQETDTYEEAFPDGTMQSGQEIQVLDKNLKDKQASKPDAPAPRSSRLPSRLRSCRRGTL